VITALIECALRVAISCEYTASHGPKGHEPCLILPREYIPFIFNGNQAALDHPQMVGMFSAERKFMNYNKLRDEEISKQ
jgi:hypothetical protein